MSGLLGALLGVVTIVASIFTYNPYGIAAGALMIVGAAAQSGILGQGAQNFEKSSVGKDLTMAVGLASAAIGIAGLMSAPAATADSAAVTSANTAAESGAATGTEADAADAAAGSTTPAAQAAGAAAPAGTGTVLAPAATVSATSNEAITNPFSMTQAFQGDASAVDSSLNPATINATNQLANGQALSGGMNGPGGPAIDGDSVHALQQNLNLGSAPSNAESAAVTADSNAVKPMSGGLPTGDPGEAQLQAAAGAGPQPVAPASQGGPESFTDKLMSGAKGAVSSPGGMLMAGQAISGWAQDKAQENINQRQLAAAQWGNTQWQDPNQISQLDAAAAAPINVPTGYLARAAAVRNLVNGSTTQSAPLQTAPPPTAQAAPALAAPGAGLAPGAAPGSGPVPVTGMSAVPRGGAI